MTVLPEADKMEVQPVADEEKVSLADESPAIITDHKFSPRGSWFTLCRHCNLAESAHAETELQYIGDGLYEGFDD